MADADRVDGEVTFDSLQLRYFNNKTNVWGDLYTQFWVKYYFQWSTCSRIKAALCFYLCEATRAQWCLEEFPRWAQIKDELLFSFFYSVVVSKQNTYHFLDVTDRVCDSWTNNTWTLYLFVNVGRWEVTERLPASLLVLLVETDLDVVCKHKAWWDVCPVSEAGIFQGAAGRASQVWLHNHVCFLPWT